MEPAAFGTTSPCQAWSWHEALKETGVIIPMSWSRSWLVIICLDRLCARGLYVSWLAGSADKRSSTYYSSDCDQCAFGVCAMNSRCIHLCILTFFSLRNLSLSMQHRFFLCHPLRLEELFFKLGGDKMSSLYRIQIALYTDQR